MIRKSLALGVAALVAGLALTSGAEARYRMVSVDYTKGGKKPKVVDNGVNDGRVCKIFFAPQFDPWTETVKKVKTKKCV